MPLRNIIQPVNWRHTLGEFVLVVAGILIALWLNEWSQDRQDRRAELELLREMRAALAADLADNRTDYEAFDDARTRLLRLQDHLQRQRPHAPGVDSLFGALVLTRVLQWNSGPYEVIRARGFELLSDDSLRSRIVHLYGTTYPFIAARYARVDEFVEDLSQGYFLRSFRGASRAGGPAVALSYERTVTDPYLANLVTWHITDLTVTVNAYRTALAEGDTVLRALDRQVRHLH